MTRSMMFAALFGTLTACGVAPAGDPGAPPPNEADPEVTNAPLAPGKGAFILAHGFGGSSDSWDLGIQPAIEAEGHTVLRTSVPATGSVESRATALAPQVDAFLAETGATQVHIIAHSMGGLDARYLISSLGYAPKVASLTTISTPHEGTPLADVALGLQQGDQGRALQALLDLTGVVDTAELDEALRDLSEANAASFAAANPDDPNVIYQSYAGLSSPGGFEIGDAAAACGGVAPDSLRPLLLLPALVVTGTDLRPNDGVVPVDSAKYGGFQGCIAADHLDEIGSFAVLAPELDVPAFYKGIATKLLP